jgi:hypothetical protein
MCLMNDIRFNSLFFLQRTLIEYAIVYFSQQLEEKRAWLCYSANADVILHPRSHHQKGPIFIFKTFLKGQCSYRALLDVANTPTTCTELYHSFIQYTGSYMFRQWSAIIRELLGFV